MRERDAADYLSIGTTMLRALLPPKKIGGRSVWDIRDLDRFADTLAGQPLDPEDGESHAAAEAERAWFERHNAEGQGNG